MTHRAHRVAPRRNVPVDAGVGSRWQGTGHLFGAATLSRQRYFPRNDETRFPPSGRGLEGNGPVSLRVELDTGGSAFRPVSQPIKGGHGPIGCSLALPEQFKPAGASNLDAVIRLANSTVGLWTMRLSG